MYKIMNKLIRIEATKLCTPAIYLNTRGHDHKIFKKKATTIHRMRSFAIRAVNDWNYLPEEVIKASSMNAFKNGLDNFWDRMQFRTN